MSVHWQQYVKIEVKDYIFVWITGSLKLYYLKKKNTIKAIPLHENHQFYENDIGLAK